MKNKKGFTLIEVLVVALLASIIGLGTITAIADSNKLLNQSTIQTMANANTLALFNQISIDVKEGVGLSEGYWNLTVHYADGSAVKWSIESIGGQWYSVRTNKDGVKKKFKPIGFKSDDGQYRYFLPYFWVNQDTNTKYNNVGVRMYIYDPSANYESHYSEAKYYCKHEGTIYGF